MSMLRRQRVIEAPKPIDPADVQNRVDQQRQRRLRSGGTQSTFLSTIAAEGATAAAPATVTGIGG